MKIRHFIAVVFIAVVMTLGGTALWQKTKAAWQDPTCDPNDNPNAPTCNVSAPLNVAGTAQTKLGPLTIGGLLTGLDGLSITGGSVDLLNDSIQTEEVEDNNLQENDFVQIGGTEGNSSGLDGTEIEDIYVVNTGDTINGNLTINGLLTIAGVGGAAAAITGNVTLTGNLSVDGIIETVGTGYFKGRGTELTHVASINNDATGSSIADIRTAAFFGYLNASELDDIHLTTFGIPRDGLSIIPVNLQALKCIDCTANNSNDWWAYDPVVEADLQYVRCNNDNFVNKIQILNENLRGGYFVIFFTYYSIPGSQIGDDECNFPGALDF